MKRKMEICGIYSRFLGGMRGVDLGRTTQLLILMPSSSSSCAAEKKGRLKGAGGLVLVWHVGWGYVRACGESGSIRFD